jgi:hypothetical protein
MGKELMAAAERIRRVEAGESKLAVYCTMDAIERPSTQKWQESLADVAHHKDAWMLARFLHSQADDDRDALEVGVIRTPNIDHEPTEREIFDAGFAACRSYGDNHIHYRGQQADQVFAAAMARLRDVPISKP